MTRYFLLLLPAMCMIQYVYAQNSSSPSTEKTYSQVARERADKIVIPIGLDAEKQTRICMAVANYYEEIHNIHLVRDESLTALTTTTDSKLSKESIQDSAELKVLRMHLAFTSQLSAELTSDQINHIKNGLTYNVVPITYKAYLELYPELKEEEKRYIMTQLSEAREFAMHAGSSDDKHHKFGKYKGRINNYLSKAGYNAKEAETALKLRKQQAVAK